MTGTFRFNEEDHSYWIGERRIPSVTGILRDAGLLNYHGSADYYMERGTFVHRATEMIDKGTLDWDSLDSTLRPYCEAYQKFINDVKPSIILSEKPLYHAGYGFAGTPDRAIRINERTSVIDFSTGNPPPAKKIQVAAYQELIHASEDIFTSQGFTLWLKDDGSYRLSPPMDTKEMKRQFNFFLAALTVVRWKEESRV